MLISRTPADIEVTPSNHTTVAVPSAVDVKKNEELVLAVKKKEYSIVGDALYATFDSGTTPDWLLNTLDLILDVRLTDALHNLDTVAADLITAISEIDLARNAYEEYINIEATVEGIIASRVTQLNARIDNANATITTIDQAYVSATQAAAIAADQISASLTTPEGLMRGAITDLQLVITSLEGMMVEGHEYLEDLSASTEFVLSANITILEAAIEDEKGTRTAEIARVDQAIVTETTALAQALLLVDGRVTTAEGTATAASTLLNRIVVDPFTEIASLALLKTEVENASGASADAMLILEAIYDVANDTLIARGALEVTAEGKVAGIVLEAGSGPSTIDLQGDIVRFLRADETVAISYDTILDDFVFDGTITAKTVAGLELVGNDIIVGSSTLAEENNTGYFEYSRASRFGLSNDLVKWFGPKIAGVTWDTTNFRAIPNGMTKLNAKTYSTVDGSVYFGGTFQAGSLFASKTNSELSNTAEVEITFGSNGGELVIACSMSFLRTLRHQSLTCPVDVGNITGQLILEERIGSNSWVARKTEDIIFTYNCEPALQEGPELIEGTYSNGASKSFTYNASQASGTRRFRARLANILGAQYSPIPTGIGEGVRQTVSITSTEA